MNMPGDLYDAILKILLSNLSTQIEVVKSVNMDLLIAKLWYTLTHEIIKVLHFKNLQMKHRKPVQ